MERYMIPSLLIESTKISWLVYMTVVDQPPWRPELCFLDFFGGSLCVMFDGISIIASIEAIMQMF